MGARAIVIPISPQWAHQELDNFFESGGAYQPRFPDNFYSSAANDNMSAGQGVGVMIGVVAAAFAAEYLQRYMQGLGLPDIGVAGKPGTPEVPGEPEVPPGWDITIPEGTWYEVCPEGYMANGEPGPQRPQSCGPPKALDNSGQYQHWDDATATTRLNEDGFLAMMGLSRIDPPPEQTVWHEKHGTVHKTNPQGPWIEWGPEHGAEWNPGSPGVPGIPAVPGSDWSMGFLDDIQQLWWNFLARNGWPMIPMIWEYWKQWYPTNPQAFPKWWASPSPTWEVPVVFPIRHPWATPTPVVPIIIFPGLPGYNGGVPMPVPVPPPGVLPTPQPGPSPVPVPSPAPLPVPEPVPWPRPSPSPQPVPRPAPGPGPSPGPRPGSGPVEAPVGAIRPLPRVGTVHRPPGPRVKERKGKVSQAVYVAMETLGALSEIGDFIDAFYKALPASIRRGVRDDLGRSPNFADKLRVMWEHYDQIDMTQGVKNFIKAQVEDLLTGIASQPFDKALQKMFPDYLQRMAVRQALRQALRQLGIENPFSPSIELPG